MFGNQVEHTLGGEHHDKAGGGGLHGDRVAVLVALGGEFRDGFIGVL